MPGLKRERGRNRIGRDPIDNSKPEFFSYDISYLNGQDQEMTTDFSYVFDMLKPLNYWIPKTWPKAKDQKGECCGLYSLEISHQYANPGLMTPVARKEKQKGIVSLREVAKQKKLSSFGEIFSVFAFEELSKHFKLEGKAHKLPEDYFGYVAGLIELLTKHHTLIVACDIDKHYPSNQKGEKTHWALIFGLILDQESECYFLVTQYGKYYLWSGRSLFESNIQLPIENPRSAPGYHYYKTELGEFFTKEKLPESIATKKNRTVIGSTLKDFRCMLFAVHAQAMGDIYLEPEQKENAAKKLRPTSSQKFSV